MRQKGGVTMQVTITLNDAQLDIMLDLLQGEIYQTERDIMRFYQEGQTNSAEFLEELCRDQKRLFHSLLKQFIDYRKEGCR